MSENYLERARVIYHPRGSMKFMMSNVTKPQYIKIYQRDNLWCVQTDGKSKKMLGYGDTRERAIAMAEDTPFLTGV